MNLGYDNTMTETTQISKVTGVNGNMVSVEFAGAVMQNEVAFVLPADWHLRRTGKYGIIHKKAGNGAADISLRKEK